MITAEGAESKAGDLMKAANELAATIAIVDNMGREGWQAVKDESSAYETIVIDGGNVCKAMRELAMRLDRAALGKFVG